MYIDIDEAKIKEYVNDAVKSKVEELTDNIIHDRVQKVICDKVDGIFANYNSIRYSVDKYVREVIRERAEIDTEQFNEAVKRISGEIACGLRDRIIESIAYNLMPDEYE